MIGNGSLVPGPWKSQQHSHQDTRSPGVLIPDLGGDFPFFLESLSGKEVSFFSKNASIPKQPHSLYLLRSKFPARLKPTYGVGSLRPSWSQRALHEKELQPILSQLARATFEASTDLALRQDVAFSEAAEAAWMPIAEGEIHGRPSKSQSSE